MSVDTVHKTITFLGCGKLNSAILEGILASLENGKDSDFQPSSQIHEDGAEESLTRPSVVLPTAFRACVHKQSSATSLTEKFSQSSLVTVLAHDNVRGVRASDIIILGVGPSVYRSVLAEPGILEALRGKILVSIVGGVSIAKIQDAIFHDSPMTAEEKQQYCHVMRVTPGMSAAVRESVSLISEDSSYRSPAAVLNVVYSLFMRVGQVKIWPEHLQPVGATVVAGGLAFFSVALEGLVDSAIREGIEKEKAFQMAASCMMGLSKLIARGESPSEVRKNVATPGGSTAAGLKVLEEGKVKESYMEALRVTTFRTSGLDNPKQ